jgi:hypothetical protein
MCGLGELPLKIESVWCGTAVLTAAVAVGLWGSPLAAQGYLAPTFETLKPTIPELVGVWERARPEYDAAGIKVGGFTWYPALEKTLSYDDNIYSTKSGTVGDWIAKVRPDIRVKSNWSVHAFEAYGMVEGIFYNDNSAEDRTNAKVGFNGIVDVTRDTRIRYFGNWVRDHEDRSVTGLFNTVAVGLIDEPVQSDVFTGGLAVEQRFNHMTVSVSGNYSHANYENSSFNSVLIDQSYRNLDSYGTRLRVGHDLGPASQVYIEGGYDRRDFKLGSFDSDTYRLVGGLSGNVTALIHGDVFAGYQQRDYDQNVVRNVDDWTYGGALSWYVSPLMTVALFGERTINESTFGGVAGSFTQSRIGTRVDYEALRNVVLTGRVGYEWDDYNDTKRADEVVSAGATSTFLINRNLSLALDYKFTNRTSNFSDLEFSRNVVGATVRMQY